MRFGVVGLMTLLCVGGCGSYAGVQVRLAESAREGLARVEAARAKDAAAVRRALGEKRERLDAAFDADVRGRGELSADWVIESRKAYAAGLTAVSAAQEAARQADSAARDNAAAADEALALLLRSLREQEKVLNLDEVLNGKGGGK